MLRRRRSKSFRSLRQPAAFNKAAGPVRRAVHDHELHEGAAILILNPRPPAGSLLERAVRPHDRDHSLPILARPHLFGLCSGDAKSIRENGRSNE